MISSLGRSCLFLVAVLSGVIVVGAQSTDPGISVPKPKVAYPDAQSGLKQLATDILKAQKENDSSRAGELLESLVLPNFREWYAENFNESAVARVVPAYTAGAPHLPTQLASVFLGAYNEGLRNIEAVRYEDEQSACSSAPIFSAMTARKTRVPLYELRFTHGDRFKRLFAFVYVDGAFRLVLIPDFSKPATQTPPAQANGPSPDVPKPEERITVDHKVQAAKLICKVQPSYPEEARMQRISGTVRMHALIGKDGSIKQLEVLSGPPKLVDAALFAVRQWRYHPTLVDDQPVEIDTTIDVIYSLNY